MKDTVNRYSSFLASILISGMLVSCEQLIEIPADPSDKISTDKAFSDSTNVLNVMAGIYNTFGVVDDGSACKLFNGGATLYTALSSDELLEHSPYSFVLAPYYDNSLRPDNGYLVYMWGNTYATLYGVNVSLESIDKNRTLSPTFSRQIKGELKVIRAWCYYHMTNLFGAIPLVTTTDFGTNSILPRVSNEEIYDFIITDLEEAQTLLRDEYPSAGHARPNRYTAKALLAKVYLHREEWDKAASLSGEVIESGMYSLEPDLNNVFLRGSTEAIWQYSTEGAYFSENNEAYNILPDSDDQLPVYEITPELFNAFEDDDLRKTNWLNAADVNGALYYFPYKYKKKTIDSSPVSEEYVFLRLAEQYLIRAEARAKLDLTDEALDDLNTIRTRAELPDRSFTDESTLLADIMHERRIELFCEWGNRWYDLKRTNMADDVLGSKPGWQSTDVLYPIPLTEIQRNPFLLPNNPGY